MTYQEEAAAFDWLRYDRYAALWREGEGLAFAAIAARFGATPCDVKRTLENGRRLEGWRCA